MLGSIEINCLDIVIRCAAQRGGDMHPRTGSECVGNLRGYGPLARERCIKSEFFTCTLWIDIHIPCTRGSRSHAICSVVSAHIVHVHPEAERQRVGIRIRDFQIVAG